MRQIICLSTSPWYPLPTSKQQIMRRLKDAEVVYFDPPVTLIAPLKDPSAKEKLFAWKKEGERITGSVTRYSLPPVLPFFNLKRGINRFNQKRLASFINRVARDHSLKNPILWVYSPSNVDIVEHIPHSALVYHCVDRHSAFGGLMDPALVDKMEEELCGKADLVITTSKGLLERLQPFNENTVFVPNGADYAHFASARETAPAPDVSGLKKPVFGFVGALQECIEYSYVEYAAKKRPDWSFVFVGNRLPGVELGRLEELPNVRFTGVRPYEEIPSFIAGFDVCLNLFAKGKLSKDVSPLKFYEYLATGLPIVSTPQPEQVLDYRSCIYIAGSPEEFVSACERALNEPDDTLRRARAEYGRRSSWDSRVGEISELLEKSEI